MVTCRMDIRGKAGRGCMPDQAAPVLPSSQAAETTMGLFDKFVPASRRTAGLQTEVQDIVDNLNNVLNTRKGYGSILGDLGIRDLNEYCSRDHIAGAIIDEVRANIERFEPRVRLVGITPIEDGNPLRISFRIDCKLRDTAQSLRMVFDTLDSKFALDRAA